MDAQAITIAFAIVGVALLLIWVLELVLVWWGCQGIRLIVTAVGEVSNIGTVVKKSN